ncbi:dihydrodipicolinate synthase family protein [Echinicola strongylocentroti]|uniref:Dihydrodipicolinate synthase family protein n=1 Tax=Echinicola strongylocentroti TaxID=1795355 RepID=A0A2Z4IJZ5_9BACT|nr:dihydrodipicolinate synthase family protein [Echinicola strongylocentroti]AWW30866.1 dihydrodipicolinate synthase family protein [Echinicola strongylocentroti]
MKTIQPLPRPFKGIVPPMITPLVDENQLDVPGLERLIHHIIAGGVHGLFILGTTGESTSLSYEIRHELVRRTCEIVDGRVPVLVGITDTAATESLRLAETAANAGAAAVVAAPPYYFSLGQPELIEYYEYLAERLSLPLFLYNMPSHTKIIIEPATVKTLSQYDNIVGLKDSSANNAYFNKVMTKMNDRPDFSLFVGPEEIMAESVLLGAHGGVNGGANMFPELYVKLFEAAVSGDMETVKKLHGIVMQISTKMYSLGQFGSSYLKGIKGALSLLGICSDYMASPLHRFREKEREVLAAQLKEIQQQL